ncbi:N2227-domain-containing protein [Hypoxylon sp. NC1633]|nr:N2227-domain-containing protein [Hypoxylon sp. NC1633]
MMELADSSLNDDSQWNFDDVDVEDPEEVRVIFCALDSFSQYSKITHLNCTHLRRQAFYALPQAHWQMLAQPPFSYLDVLDRVDAAIETNAELARNIVKFGLQSFGFAESAPGEQLTVPEEWSGISKPNDTDKARSTVRQFYRDWSAEGAVERDACYGPIYSALDAEKTTHGKQSMEILVPGAGLGRLVFELCRMGHLVEGNEISYHQLLASSYILNHTETAGQHTIYPWIHSFSNHRNRDNQFRSYKIPDIHPQTTLTESRIAEQVVGSMQMIAADFLCQYGDDEHIDTYDAVAAVFFLDTAPNLIRYLEVIRSCLKPGGILINVGPLLWHWENHVPGHNGYDGDGDYDESKSQGIGDPGSFELTDDEVVELVKRMGFRIEKRESGLRAPYVQDDQSMLQTVYNASYWIARKTETWSDISPESQSL